MNADQINERRDTFRRAMIGWDVPVSVAIKSDWAEVCFKLWGAKFKGTFCLEKGQWSDGNDCPHYINNSDSVWQWIAMQLHNKCTA